MPCSTCFISAKNLKKEFGQEDKKTLKVLNNITIDFEKGKKYAIIGSSGSGKSTLLHILGKLDNPTSGSVNLSANSTIGFVFQFHYLINEMTVLENIILNGLINGKNKKDCITKANNLLNRFGLSDKSQNYPFQLSGGEQQRVSILRAIFNKPDFLLADEPTGNLDEQNGKIVLDFLIDCQKEWNMGLILCSHDKTIYEKMEYIFELKDGQLNKLKKYE